MTPAGLEDIVRKATERLNAGDARAAESALRPIVARNPRHPGALFCLGRAQFALGQFAAAKRSLDACMRLAPGTWQVMVELSKCYQFSGDFDRALELCDQAHQLKSDSSEVVARKAETLRVMGHHDEAASLLEPIVTAEQFGLGEISSATVYARIRTAQGDLDAALSAIRRALEVQGVPHAAEAQLHFQAGATLDAQGAYDEAWTEAAEGNAITGRGFDVRAFSDRIRRNLETWTRERFLQTPTAADRRERVVFIIGTPRSGTTLLEQTLSRHSDIGAAGETELVTLAAHDLAQATDGASLIPTESSLRKIARKRARELSKLGGGAEVIIEKTPTNFLFIPLLSKLFPESRIILCRRQPLDVAVSCFFQDFGPALAWSCSLDGIAAFFESFESAMRHWQDVCQPELLEIDYEEFVSNHEEQTRRALDYIGVEWDDACLRPEESKRVANTASLEQVRRPVHTRSVARHEHYSEQLAPLRARLGIS